MSAHTPGPLVARRINNDPKPFAVINPHGRFGDEIVAGYLGEADATLYAAAPDMLHALEMVRDANRDDPHIPSIALATIEAAIAKATGGDQ